MCPTLLWSQSSISRCSSRPSRAALIKARLTPPPLRPRRSPPLSRPEIRPLPASLPAFLSSCLAGGMYQAVTSVEIIGALRMPCIRPCVLAGTARTDRNVYSGAEWQAWRGRAYEGAGVVKRRRPLGWNGAVLPWAAHRPASATRSRSESKSSFPSPWR